MEFIATNLIIWLMVMVAGYGYALFNQIRRMKGMMKSSAFSDAEGAFFKGIAPMFISAFVGMGGMVLLGIAIVVNIISSAG